MSTTAMPPRIDADWINDPCDPNRTYGGPEAAMLAEVTFRQLDHWLRNGLLGENPTVGSGNRRRFTLADLEVIHACGALVNAGFTVQAAVAAAHAIASTGRWETRSGVIYQITIEAVSE